MPPIIDGPKSPLFTPIRFQGNAKFSNLPNLGVSRLMAKAIDSAPSGECICNGIPFEVADPFFVKDQPVQIDLEPVKRKRR